MLIANLRWLGFIILLSDPAPLDRGPHLTNGDGNILTLDFIGSKYRAQAEFYDLDPLALAETLLKYVFMHRYKPMKLEKVFLKQTDTQKAELGETVSRINSRVGFNYFVDNFLMSIYSPQIFCLFRFANYIGMEIPGSKRGL